MKSISEVPAGHFAVSPATQCHYNIARVRLPRCEREVVPRQLLGLRSYARNRECGDQWDTNRPLNSRTKATHRHLKRVAGL